MENNDSNVNHVYDGIIEQNNAMPTWWVWSFILTVIFGFLYWVHYSLTGGPTLMDEFQADLAAYEQKVAAAQNTAQVETEETLEKYMKNDAFIATGGKIYAEKCSMCHGAELEGKIGPNLVDNFWIHGKGTRMDLVQSVAKGIPAKGMPPWEGMLKANEIKNVVAFLVAKHGTNPPNAKAPEGVEVK
jgi:cytochrome c oxidase cbb3-type subunit 3